MRQEIPVGDIASFAACQQAFLMLTSVAYYSFDMQAVRRSTMERLQPLSQADASSACTSWLGHLTKDIEKHCPAPMAACASPADFASLEAHLQAAIGQWQPTIQSSSHGTTQLQFQLPLLERAQFQHHICFFVCTASCTCPFAYACKLG